MYHHVNPHKGDMVTVDPEVFEKQMEFLHNSGYRTLKADELAVFAKGDLVLEEKAVLVTFDDGWLDNYIYAFPVLKKYNINAVIFIVTDRTESASADSSQSPSSVPDHEESKALIAHGKAGQVVLKWEHVREMMESGLVEFYSHTQSHRKCNSLSEDELAEELSISKKIMEERLEKQCPYLCWPYGKYNGTAVKVAKEAGYSMLFTTHHGVVKKGSDLFEIKRIVIKDKVAWFKNRMRIYTNSFLSEFYLRTKKR